MRGEFATLSMMVRRRWCSLDGKEMVHATGPPTFQNRGEDDHACSPWTCRFRDRQGRWGTFL